MIRKPCINSHCDLVFLAHMYQNGICLLVFVDEKLTYFNLKQAPRLGILASDSRYKNSIILACNWQLYSGEWLCSICPWISFGEELETPWSSSWRPRQIPHSCSHADYFWSAKTCWTQSGWCHSAPWANSTWIRWEFQLR